MEDDAFVMADVPNEFRALRACLRCGLIKEFSQFNEVGCENCPFLQMDGNTPRIEECTTSYFEGMIALVDPQKSWVAKWQRIAAHFPGLYAIDVAGGLPDDVLDYCENKGIDCKAKRQ